MTVFSSVWVWIILVLAVFLHAVSVILPCKYVRVVIFANIALHIAMFSVVLLMKAPYDEIVTLYMISVFVYTLCSFLKYKFGRGTK